MSEQNKQKVNWGDFTPVSEVKKNNAVDWDQFTPIEKDSEQGKGFLGHAQDAGASLMKGLAAVPETIVGLADIPTGGRVGKFIEQDVGLDLKGAKEYWGDKHTDQYKAQQQEFEQADGIIDKTKVALSNPSMIFNTVVQSTPEMLLGGAAAKGLGMVSKLGAIARGALGEGAVMAGHQASAIRGETEDGLLTPEQSGLSVATGALGALFGYAGGQVARKLGFDDINTAMASGRLNSQQVAGEIQKIPFKSIPKSIIGGALTEGLLEELPQSVSEQILQNMALNKPLDEGVDSAIVMGTLAGMAMGGGMNTFSAPMNYIQNNRAYDAQQQAIAREEQAQQDIGSQIQYENGLNYTPEQIAPNDQSQATQQPASYGNEVDYASTPVSDSWTLDGEQQQSQDYGNSIEYESPEISSNLESQIQFNDTYGQDMPDPVIDYGALSPFNDAQQPIIDQTKLSERLGINPNDGPMSSAAALAVDSGASPVVQNAPPVTTADAIKHGMSEISRGMDEGARNQVAEYLRNGNTDRLTYRKEDAINAALANPNYNVQRNDDGSVTVVGVKTADGNWHGVSNESTTAQQSQAPTTSVPTQQFSLNTEAQEPTTATKPNFSSHHPAGTVTHAQDIADQALQQYSGDTSALANKSNGLFKHTPATELIYSKNSPSYSDVEVVDAGDKAIVKLTNSRTGAVEERVYPHELVRFNDFLNGNQQQVENLSNISNKNNIDTISAQTEEVEAAPLSSQIAQLEQQLSETKPVPQRNSIKKQINELKSQLENQGRASWEGMSLEQRQAVVEQIETNMPLGMRNRLPTAEWDRIGPAVKAKLIGAMGQSIQPLTNRPVSQPQIEDGSPQVSTNHPFQQYDTVAQQYGRSVSPNGVILSSDGKDTGVRIVEKKGRVHVESSNGQLLHTGADANSIGNFLEKFWGDKKSNNPSSQIDTNAHEAATSPLNDTLAPTQAQIEAGNYKKGHIRLNGLDISIENPKGSTRSGNRPDGTQWEHTMSDHYGYIKRTKGADNEHIDTYIGSNPDSDQVFIVDQLDQETGNFDEHKVMLGFDSQEEAATAYKSNFDKGWKVGPIRNMDMEQFKDWLKNEDTSKPATDNKTVKPESTGGITHIEGKQSETATNDVVEESFDKAQDNLSKANYDRMRNGLIADIEQAIQDAHQSAKTVGQDDKGNPIYEQITFDVKGDGKFNVRNDKSTLTRFLKQVKANAGFKPVSKKGSGDLRHDSNYLNPKSVHRKTSIDDIKTMLTENFDEYSMDNAYQMAKSAGIDVIFVNEPKNGIVPYFVAEQIAEVENNPFYLVLRKEEQGTSYVVVSENGTPLAESAGTMKAATEKALANIKKHGDEIILKGLRSERSRLKEQGITQNGLKAEFEKEINALFGDEIDGQNVSENVSKNTPESSEKSETNDEFESSDTQNNVSKNVIQDEDGIERIHDEDSSSENKQDNSLLDKMKAKLARLEAEFDVIFNDMPFMGHGGTPFVDNSKGRQMKRNHEKREERLQAKKREIEEQKEKISNMEHRIVSRNTPTKKSQKFLDDNPIHQGLFELEKQGLVKQWKKNPQYFFVNGMDKVALATWDGEISFAKRFPVKNKEELEKVKALIAQANELAKNNTKDYSRKIPLKPDEERKGVSPLNTTFKPLSVVSATRQVFSILEHLKIVTTQIDASVRGRIVVGWQRVGVNKVKGLDSHSFTVQVVESFDGLPSAIQEDNRYQGENGETKRYDVLGVWHNGTLYINAGDIQGNNSTQQTTFEMYEELILHEVVGHFGVQQIFGREYKTKLQQLFNALGGLEGIRKIAKDNGVDMQQFNDVYINPRMQAVKDEIYTESDVQQSLVGELFAFVAQNAKSRPFVRQKLKEAIGYIRQWFRDRGFDKFLSRYNDADLMMFLSEARKAVVDRSYFGKYKNQEFSSKNDSNTPLYSRKSGNQKTGKTIAQVREALIKRFGKATIEALEKQGKFEIIQDYQVEGVEGYYRNGKAVLVASNLNDDTIIPTFLHELGGHAGFQNMMKPEQYADLMRQFDRMVEQGNPIALEAKKLAEREQGSERQQLEYLPYLLTLASNTQIKHAIHKGSVARLISDLISKVKAWIYDRLGVNLNLNPNDMVALAERMVSKAAKADAVTSQNSDTQFSQKVKSVFTDAFTVAKSEQERIAKDIDNLLGSLVSRPEPVKMKMSPVLLALDGVSGLNVQDLPLHLDRFTLRKIMGQVDGKQDISHQLTLDQVKQLYSEIVNPVMVLKSSATGGLVVVTSMQDKAGNPIISAIHLEKKDRRYVINDIASAYGRSNYDAWISKQLGNIVYINDKSPALVRSVPTQLRKMVHQNKASGQTILTPDDVVNFFGHHDKTLYSRQSMQDTIDKLSQNLKQFSVKSVKDKTSYKWADWLGVGLQFLGRRQLTEIYAKLLPQLSKYNELAAQMDADKNDAGAEADNIVREWANLKDENQLAELMHDSTLAKIDPTKPYVSGDSISKYNQLRDAYNSLSPEAQAMYVKARDAYKQHYAEVHQAIKERILRSELSNQKKADLLKQMDDNFFGQIKGVYFPLARFGKYVVVMRNQNGEVESVSRAETMGEAQALRSELMQKYPHYKVDRVTLDKEFNTSRDAVGRGFMSSLFAEVENLGLSAAEQAEFEDTLSQLYLSSMPDLSWAKHGIHRKGTAGFSQDARRAFAQNMFGGANYLAKLRYGDQLAQQLDDMQKYASEQSKLNNSYDQPTAQRVIDEMNKRHDNLMNPKGHPLSSALTSLGFIYYLGLSPAAAMVNLSQTALVAYPLMGAKWNFDKAGKELLKAAEQFRKSVEFHQVKWEGTKTDLYKAVSADISKFLNEDEKKAYQKAVDSGVIDVTQAHDLAGIAQGEDSGVMWKTRPIMRAASVMFHSAERFNREVTFIAAYRLARQAGEKHDSAFDQAVDMTYKGHFDYSSGNRPRIMQGNVAKVVLLFKQFGQNMLYTLARQTYQSIKGETEAERKEARRALAVVLVMHATFAGALGLPGVWFIMAIASAWGGDDDEPWDAEVALRNYLAEAFNPTISNMLMKGAPRGIGVDISSRVGINNLLLPDVQEGLEGKKLWDSASAAALGPIGGIGANVAKGAQEISEGHNLRGVESMLPVFLKNFVKTYRYADEGVQDKTGVSILDEVDSMDLLVQSMGFSPADVRTANEGKSAIYQYDRKLSERRSRLMTLWSRAKMLDDQQEMDEIWDEIQAFNEKNPSLRITRINLNQSYRQRQRRIDRAEDGIYLPRNRQDARDAGYFAFGE